MSFREQWESLLSSIATRLGSDEIDVTSKGRVSVHHFYCTSVMAVVQCLRRFTRAKDEQGQHDVLKILFKWFLYGNRGRYEVKRGKYRIDIWIDDMHEAIEVKTIVDVSAVKLKGKLSKVLRLKEKKHRQIDKTWFVFFYKFKGDMSPKKACKYLLCLIDINLAGKPNRSAINQDLVSILHKSKAAVAEKFNIDEDIIIPVDNIMLAEDLEREIKEKDAVIEDQAKVLANKEKTIADHEKTITDQEKTIAELKKRLGMH
jgi:hypothetical protein